MILGRHSIPNFSGVPLAPRQNWFHVMIVSGIFICDCFSSRTRLTLPGWSPKVYSRIPML